MSGILRRVACVLVVLAGCTEQGLEPNLTGQDVHLTVVHTADLHSRFFPYYFAPGAIDKGLGLSPKTGQTTAVVGGIARVSTIIKCIRGIYAGPSCYGITETDPNDPLAPSPIAGAPAQRSLHVDSGDIFEGAPVFNQFNGEVEMRAMSEIGLSSMALGNHEFDKGSVNLAQQITKFGGFPIMAANYQFGDPNDYTQPKLRTLIHPYSIFNVDGVTIGVIGMGNLSSIEGIIEGGNTLGVRPIEATQAMADTVRVVRPQVDVLFVTSHLGLDEDEGVAAGAAESEDQNLQIAQDGVDAIFGGHLHIVLNPPKDLPHFDDAGAVKSHTVLCHSGAFAKYVGRLDLVIHFPSAAEQMADAAARPSVKAYTYKIIPIDDSIKEDPAMVSLLEPYQIKMNQFLNLTQTYALVACANDQATCPKVQRNDPDGGDSQLGNLVATAMRLRKRVEADFALTNSLGIRADFEAGALNLEEMYNVFPFDNTLTTMFLSGNETQQMLDFVAQRSSERGCRTQAQVSGIYFDLVCNPDDPECNARQDMEGLGHGACAKNIYLGDNCRMPDGTFNGTPCTPLDPFGEYRVAVNDYIAQGGSGFAVLKRNTTKFNTGISLRDALIDYMRTLPNRCDATQYTNVVGVYCKDPQGETYDCSKLCCCHDPDGDAVACGSHCDAFASCSTQGLSPSTYDYRGIPCIDPVSGSPNAVQTHDGRIQTFTGGGGQ